MRTRPDVVKCQVVGGHTIHRDEAGYLLEPEEWDEAVAEQFAVEEDIVLDQEHWAVLLFMRRYLADNGIAADARFVFHFLAEHLGVSNSVGRRRFFDLFPYGYVKQACKIAGMRQPRAWSTG